MEQLSAYLDAHPELWGRFTSVNYTLPQVLNSTVYNAVIAKYNKLKFLDELCALDKETIQDLLTQNNYGDLETEITNFYNIQGQTKVARDFIKNYLKKFEPGTTDQFAQYVAHWNNVPNYLTSLGLNSGTADFIVERDWLRSNINVYLTLAHHRNQNSSKAWIDLFQSEAVKLAMNNECNILASGFEDCVAEKIAFEEFDEAVDLLNQVGYETYEKKMRLLYNMKSQVFEGVPCPNCLDWQKTVLSSRHIQAKEKLNCALIQLSVYDGTNPIGIKNALVANFGGNYSKILAKTIKAHLAFVQDRSITATYANQMNGEGNCGPKTVAWAVPLGFEYTDIRLCDPVFWNSNVPEQWSTLIHEWMHQYLAKADFAYYGSPEYNNLNTLFQLDNADAFSEFVRDACP